MAATKRRYPLDEFARRGDAAYEAKVRPYLNDSDNGKFAAIDIESGEYEIDADELAATDRLHARVPGAQVWMVRVGSSYVHRFCYNEVIQEPAGPTK